MGASREITVVGLDGARLMALCAEVSSGGVVASRWLAASRPDSTPADNAAAVGEWIGQELKQAGMARTRVVVAASRADVVLKQLSLPPGLETEGGDVAAVVRLQMVRQLTMGMDGTAIDYVPMGAVEGGGQSVMAGAMPAERLAWWRGVADGAGAKLKRIGLRCAGAACLLAELSQRRAGPVLGVAVGAFTTEFVVVEDGQMAAARSVDLTKPASREEIDGFGERLAIEAKRTWMSHRSTKAGPDVEVVAVLGEGEVARRVGDQCAVSLGVRCEAVGLPRTVVMPESMPESERAFAAPLVGLLLEGVLGRPGLDFANPRRAPDRGAQLRQRALVGALVLIGVVGFAGVWAKRDLEQRRTQLAELETKRGEKQKELDQYLIEHARVSHLEQWTAAKVDWLSHVRALSDQLPDPRDALVDELSGKLIAAAAYDPKNKAYPLGQWGVRQQATFEVSGKVDNRQVTTDLRERLLGGGVYRVESKGPDTPDKFSLELVTSMAEPKGPEVAKAPAESKDAKKSAPVAKAPGAKGGG